MTSCEGFVNVLSRFGSDLRLLAFETRCCCFCYSTHIECVFIKITFIITEAAVAVVVVDVSTTTTDEAVEEVEEDGVPAEEVDVETTIIRAEAINVFKEKIIIVSNIIRHIK